MKKEVVTILSRKPSETINCGRCLAKLLRPGDIVALNGDLGSGKTVMAQGICQGLDVRDHVTSPSFTVIQEYTGKRDVYHFDFYRLESVREIENLDLDGYFEKDGISLIEWAERGKALLPEDRFSVQLERIYQRGRIVDGQRKIVLSGPPNRGLDRLRS
jgi:tRNA threonylcarbamoyladenosine biosynthesis protein TsaE